jgi:hypothetical protein
MPKKNWYINAFVEGKYLFQSRGYCNQKRKTNDKARKQGYYAVECAPPRDNVSASVLYSAEDVLLSKVVIAE